MATSDEPFLVGAVDDAVRHPGPALAQLQDAGFGAVGITSFWQPGLTAPTGEELAVLRTSPRGPARRGSSSASTTRAPSTTPLTTEARARVRLVRRRDRARRAGDPRRDRRQRAEPQPLLAAAVRRGRERRRRAGLLRAALEVYDAAKEADADVPDLGRRAGAARDRPAGHGPRHPLADDVHPRPRRRLPRERPLTSRRSTASPSIPTRRARASPPDRPTDPESTSILMADYEEKLRPLLDEAFGPGLPVLYSELGVETAIPAEKAALYEGAEPGQAGRRGDPGRLLPPRDRARRLPGERRRACCSSTPTTSRRSPASSPASTTSTGRRSRASSPCARRSGDAGCCKRLDAWPGSCRSCTRRSRPVRSTHDHFPSVSKTCAVIVKRSGSSDSGTSSVTPTVTAVDGRLPNSTGDRGRLLGSTSRTLTSVTVPPNPSWLSHST